MNRGGRLIGCAFWLLVVALFFGLKPTALGGEFDTTSFILIAILALIVGLIGLFIKDPVVEEKEIDTAHEGEQVNTAEGNDLETQENTAESQDAQENADSELLSKAINIEPTYETKQVTVYKCASCGVEKTGWYKDCPICSGKMQKLSVTKTYEVRYVEQPTPKSTKYTVKYNYEYPIDFVVDDKEYSGYLMFTENNFILMKKINNLTRSLVGEVGAAIIGDSEILNTRYSDIERYDYFEDKIILNLSNHLVKLYVKTDFGKEKIIDTLNAKKVPYVKKEMVEISSVPTDEFKKYETHKVTHDAIIKDRSQAKPQVELAQGRKASKINFCRKCGKKLETGSEFCRHCGTKVEYAGSAPADIDQEPAEAVKPSEPVEAKVKAASLSSVVNNAALSPKLKRAFLFIEDGNFSRADEYIEAILDEEPDNAYAYLAKVLIETRTADIDSLNADDLKSNNNYKFILRFGTKELKNGLNLKAE